MNAYEWAGMMVLSAMALFWVGLTYLVWLWFGGSLLEAGFAGFGMLYLVYWGFVSAIRRKRLQ